MNAPRPPFDPYALLAALERRRVAYVLIGGFARVIQGTDELTQGLDLTPSLRPENLRRLALVLAELDAERVDRRTLTLDEATIREQPVLALGSPYGELKLVPEPAGTRSGYDDLRRAATREPLGKGFAPASRLSRTSPACSPPSAANKTYRPCSNSDTSASSNSGSAADSSADPPERWLQPSAYRN